MSATTSRAHPCNLNAQDGPDGCDPPRIVELLSDPIARDLFTHLEDPATPKELSTACELSSSTTYRKLDQLEAAGLIMPIDGLSSTDATQFARAIDCVSITYDEPLRIQCQKSGLTLHCEV